MLRMKISSIFLKKRFVVLSLVVVYAMLVLLTEYIFSLQQRNYVGLKKQQTYADISLVRARLENQINTSLNLAKGVVVEVILNPDITQRQFEKMARILLARDSHIRNIGLARNTVITHLYPLKGNEAALGLRYLDNPAQAGPVKRAIETGETVIAGPVDLVQGGKAFIARIPIYMEDSRYWGISSVVIDIESLYRVSGVTRKQDRFQFVLKGHDALGEEGKVFMGDPALFDDPDTVTMRVYLPLGQWILGARPLKSYGSSRVAWLVRILGHLSALAIVLLLFWTYYSVSKIRHYALHDSLTEIPNRRLLYEYMEVAKKAMKRTGEGFSIFYMDLDGFKRINDSYGHKAGDIVLKMVAERITSVIRPEDIPARIGGDEFVVLFRGMVDSESIEKKKVVLEKVIGKAIKVSDTTVVSVGASIGVSRYPDDGDTHDSLLFMADRKMYKVKTDRKNRAPS